MRPMLSSFLRLASWIVLCASTGRTAAQEPAPAPIPLPTPPAWEKLKAAYDYNNRVLVVVKEIPREDDTYFRLHLSFTNPSGQLVTGVFLRPKAEGVYPCALLLHGAGGSKDNMMARFGPKLVAKGIACLALDAARHGERAEQPLTKGPYQGLYGAATRLSIIDYRITLDYLQTRKDIDGRRIGLVGYSMGSQYGAILGAVDERIRAALLCVGGDPVRLMFLNSVPKERQEEIEFVSASNYVGHLRSRPILMLNGKQDNNITAEMTKLLYEAAQEPKEIRWTDAGHALPVAFLQEGVDWLAEKLAPKAAKPAPP